MELFKNKKRIFSLSVAALIVLAAVLVVKALPSNEVASTAVNEIKGTLVEVVYPEAGTLEQTYSSTGKLTAVNRFEIFSQVEGQLLPSAINFRAGNTYKKGEVILEVDQDEFKMSVLAKKSDFVSMITGILPDLKSDYPTSYPLWRNYVSSIDVNKALPEIPVTTNEQEKFYLSGKGVFSAYYNVRSSEEKLAKYTMRAPFDGVVVLANVQAGTAVRNGSSLGTLISTSTYDLEITVPLSLLYNIKVGSSAKLHSSDINGVWTGKVVRIGGDIDEKSQSVNVYIRTEGKELKEGLYLSAELDQNPFENAMSLPRKMVNDNGKAFIVEDNKLKEYQVNVLARRGDLAIIEALPQGTAFMTTVIKSAYDGMPVRIANKRN
ncbi:MAG: efflux RND transporter periplasmic adaptor subunit [Prolixibacteraceae bacterium]